MHLWVPTPSAPLRHVVEFSVRMKPKSWQRVRPVKTRSGHVIMVKPEANRTWQADFRDQFVRRMSKQKLLDLFPWPGPVVLINHFLFARPKCWYDGKEKDSRPDEDNLAKQVADALSPRAGAVGGFGAYHDDAQIIARVTSKMYSDLGDAVVCKLLLFEKVDKPRGASKKT